MLWLPGLVCMLEGRNTPSGAAAILFGVTFAGEGVRHRCFGFLA
jgi:hypothetical protein